MHQSCSHKGHRPQVAFYAVGGGIGHLVRSLAIARQLSALGLSSVVITNCSFFKKLQGEGIPIEFVDTTSGVVAEQAEKLLGLIENAKPELLVVDTFPAGLTGELSPLLKRMSGPKVLIARPKRGEFQASLVKESYDLVLIPEDQIEDGISDDNCSWVGPIIIRDKKELLSSKQARDVLAVDKDLVLLVSHHGYPGEVDHLFDLVKRLQRRLRRSTWDFRYASLRSIPEAIPRRDRVSYFPLIELFAAVDLYIGASGYNSFHEAKAMQVPSLFLPRSRRYDDQVLRASRAGALTFSPEEFEIELLSRMEKVEAGASPGKVQWLEGSYPNGAYNAACAIAKLL